MPAPWLVGMTHLLGWLGVALLLGSLSVSLAARFVPTQRPRLVAWRRLAGLAGFGAALLHAALALWGLLRPLTASDALAMLAELPYVRQGALALVLLLPLVLTSWPKLNARSGLRTWSTLHRAVYLALALVCLHVLAGPAADPRLALVLPALLLALLLGRLLPGRSGSGPSRRRAGPSGEGPTDSEDQPPQQVRQQQLPSSAPQPPAAHEQSHSQLPELPHEGAATSASGLRSMPDRMTSASGQGTS